jgi:hypothetical protein
LPEEHRKDGRDRGDNRGRGHLAVLYLELLCKPGDADWDYRGGA